MSSTQTQAPPAKLLAEFPPVSYDDWRKVVEAELKGAPFDKKMFTTTPEGIKLNPIYRREDTANLPFVNTFPGSAPYVRGSKASGYLKQSWDVAQKFTQANPADFNASAKDAISRGVTSLKVNMDKAFVSGQDPDSASVENVGKGGLSVANVAELDKALRGIDLSKTALQVGTGGSSLQFAGLLANVIRARKKGKGLAGLRGVLETDPLGVLALEGSIPQSLDSAYNEMAALTDWASKNAPQLQTIAVYGCPWHEAGGNAVQELAYTLATGVEYLRQMDKRGLPVETTAPKIRFTVTVGVTFFTEIAKLRALRLLWSRVVSAAGGSEAAQKPSIHVRTSNWNKTTWDPYNNLLRTTVEAFAGVLGSCDSMQVGAFDEVVRQPDDFSQRIARNQQLVLSKECNLDATVDPAGGSWYIESLTSELANRAWALFQEIEKSGGMEAALKAGIPQKAVAASAADRIKGVTRRRNSIVGVNQYANTKEIPLEVPVVDLKPFTKKRLKSLATFRSSLDEATKLAITEKLAKLASLKGAELVEGVIDAVSAGATIGAVTTALRGAATPTTITPVCITRAAVPVEKLRNAMEAFVKKTGKRPAIYLCNLGSVKEYKARADFSRGFLSVGGFDIISPAGVKTTDEAVAGFVKSGAKVAVICNIDDNYPTLVPPMVQGIRAAVPDATIILAGYPEAQVEAHKATGVNEFIHIRADVVELLTKLQIKLGIQ